MKVYAHLHSHMACMCAHMSVLMHVLGMHVYPCETESLLPQRSWPAHFRVQLFTDKSGTWKSWTKLLEEISFQPGATGRVLHRGAAGGGDKPGESRHGMEVMPWLGVSKSQPSSSPSRKRGTQQSQSEITYTLRTMQTHMHRHKHTPMLIDSHTHTDLHVQPCTLPGRTY